MLNAAVALVQSVEHLFLEVQLSDRCRFKSRLQHKVVGEKILAAPSMGEHGSKFGKKNKQSLMRAVVVAQLVTSDTRNFIYQIFYQLYNRKDNEIEKEAGNGPSLKKGCC